MADFNINKLFVVPQQINTKKLNPHRFPLYRVDFATCPAQPTLSFVDPKSNTVISIAAAPILFLDPMVPNGLNYTVQVISPAILDGEELGTMVGCVLESMPMSHISDVRSGQDKHSFRIAIDKVPHVETSEAGDIYTYMIVATIEVDDSCMEDNLRLLNNQLAAHQLLQKGTRNEFV